MALSAPLRFATPARLREVQAALCRMDAGTFGVCVECQENINLKRLNAVPWASSCLVCQEAADREQEAPWGEVDTSSRHGSLKRLRRILTERFASRMSAPAGTGRTICFGQFFVVLFILWLLGFSLSIGGGLIHLLLVVALVVSRVQLGNPPPRRRLLTRHPKFRAALREEARRTGVDMRTYPSSAKKPILTSTLGLPAIG